MRNGKSQRRLHQCLFYAIRARRAARAKIRICRAPRSNPAGAARARREPVRRARGADGWYFVGEARAATAIRGPRNTCGRPAAASLEREKLAAPAAMRPSGGRPAPQEERHAYFLACSS
jgi:hypothetical protein